MTTSAAFSLSQLSASGKFERFGEGQWCAFLETRALQAGIYRVPAGATDVQTPHDDDEIYYVLKGKARLGVDDPQAGTQEYTAVPGAILYVAAHAPHRFTAVEEDLELLVFFAKA